MPQSHWARIPRWLVLAVILAYHGFIVLLLTSSSIQDQKGGALFLLNTPPLLLWMAALIRSDRRSFLVGLFAAAIQVLINTLMVFWQIGELMAVCMINGVIAFTFSVLAGICRVAAQRNKNAPAA